MKGRRFLVKVTSGTGGKLDLTDVLARVVEDRAAARARGEQPRASHLVTP